MLTFFTCGTRETENICAMLSGMSAETADEGETEQREPSVVPLVRRYKRARAESDRLHIEHLIERKYRKALTGVCPDHLLSRSVKMLTDLTLRDVCGMEEVDHGPVFLYCRVSTVEALDCLQEMVEAGRVSGAIDYLLSLCDYDTELHAAVSLSAEEYRRAFTRLTMSTVGKQFILYI